MERRNDAPRQCANRASRATGYGILSLSSHESSCNQRMNNSMCTSCALNGGSFRSAHQDNHQRRSLSLCTRDQPLYRAR